MQKNEYKIESLYDNNITIEWDIFNHCNINCEYCELEFHRENNEKNHKTKNGIRDGIISIINKIDKSRNVLLNILGGEPTLFPELEKYINRIDDRVRVRIYSNNTKDNNYLFNRQLEWYLTYHPTQVEESIFIKNLISKNNKYSRIKVLIMISEQSDIKRARKVIDVLEELKIYYDIGKPFDMTGSYLSDIKIDELFNMPKNIIVNGELESYYNLEEVSNGYMCSKKLYFLDINGNVWNNDQDNTKFNIFEKPDYFNTIDMNKRWYCGNKKCNLLPESEYSKRNASILENKIYIDML